MTRLVIITRDIKEGYEACGKHKMLSEERVYAFSGGRFNTPGWLCWLPGLVVF